MLLRRRQRVDPHEDLLVELATLNTAIIHTLGAVAAVLDKAGVPREAFAEKLLHSGRDAIALPNSVSVPQRQRDVVIQRARARYVEMIDAVYRSRPRL